MTHKIIMHFLWLQNIPQYQLKPQLKISIVQRQHAQLFSVLDCIMEARLEKNRKIQSP